MISSKTLVIDIGNTRVKTGIFEGDDLKEVKFWNEIDLINPEPFDHLFVSNVSGINIDDWIKNHNYKSIEVLDRATKLPIKLDYDTPETLGFDRIAGAVGAAHEFPDTNLMVIDLGSCITIDIIDNQERFLGGVISPGLEMRAKAMHQFTGNLPSLSFSELSRSTEKIGKSTRACMQKGVVDGIVSELHGFFEEFERQFGELTIIMTGGDYSVFESKIKEPIFVRPNLILKGLYRIFKYNVI